MHPRSTTARFAALVFLLQLAAAAALLLPVRALVRDQVYANATATADMIRQDLLAIRAEAGVRGLIDAVRLRARTTTGSDAVLLLADADGRAVAGNLAGWPGGVLLDDRTEHVELRRRGHGQSEAMLVRATRLPDGTRLLTGSVVDDERRIVKLLERATLIALALAVAFAALAAWLAARMIVVRLNDTVATLRTVRDGDLSRRVADDRSGDAFAALAMSVNATLDRVQSLVAELTLATDIIAHDLKSPLTRLRSALERAAVTVRDPAAQEDVDRALAEGDRLLAIVETALRISRAEAGIGRDAFAPLDLGDALRDLAEMYAPLIEDAGRDVRLAIDDEAIRPAHRELIAQALGNLVDNALKYGVGTITLGLVRATDRIHLSIADQGAGIAPEHHGTALRRFGRIDEARGGAGVGLGLSLVAAVARLHDGAVRLEHAAPGLRVVIDLPAGD